MHRVLIAGVGNIFCTDDGFGPEVLRHLMSRQLPMGCVAVDYGIRGLHLIYDLLDGAYDLLVLVDAAARGQQPGTVSLVEVDRTGLPDAPLDAHGMAPGAMLAQVSALGGAIDRVLLLACEPAELGDGLGLSPVVAAAVPAALAALEDLLTGVCEEVRT